MGALEGVPFASVTRWAAQHPNARRNFFANEKKCNACEWSGLLGLGAML